MLLSLSRVLLNRFTAVVINRFSSKAGMSSNLLVSLLGPWLADMALRHIFSNSHDKSTTTGNVLNLLFPQLSNLGRHLSGPKVSMSELSKLVSTPGVD